MNSHRLYSDQLLMWSVKNDRAKLLRPQTTPPAIAAQTAATGLRASGLLDRALQALRQSKLQVRQWSRPWAQVLPLGKLPGQGPADGLRPPGRLRAGQRSLGQLHPASRDLGGDLRDQPRTAASARSALRCSGEPGPLVAHRSHRSVGWRNAAGQHAHRHDRGRPNTHAVHGGQR